MNIEKYERCLKFLEEVYYEDQLLDNDSTFQVKLSDEMINSLRMVKAQSEYLIIKKILAIMKEDEE